jgi:hypothetical protein
VRVRAVPQVGGVMVEWLVIGLIGLLVVLMFTIE